MRKSSSLSIISRNVYCSRKTHTGTCTKKRNYVHAQCNNTFSLSVQGITEAEKERRGKERGTELSLFFLSFDSLRASFFHYIPSLSFFLNSSACWFCLGREGDSEEGARYSSMASRVRVCVSLLPTVLLILRSTVDARASVRRPPSLLSFPASASIPLAAGSRARGHWEL